MQTQCPHCETTFRITEIQIHTADGFVRCGICKEVFNTIDVANQHKHQQSLLLDTQTKTESLSTIKQIIASDSDITQLNPLDVTVDNYDTETTTDTSRDAFDFFDEDKNASLEHVVPDKYRETKASKSHSLLSVTLWGLGVLFLTATLTIEYIWFNRDQLKQIPELQIVFNQLCQHIECKKISLRAPEKIALITRNVYSHPKEKDALMINVTMTNKAKFAQPYPVMQIDFSDRRGGIVAARRFLPSEYLPAETDETTLIPPDTSTSVTLEIKDPGKQAVTYEFNFL
ncbi:MAG: hypothetical protein COB77_01690 [Gammaproteobacteria bacterium]|nr:MAG: hypothetical protein COB77_01690 [Gammaproteobacteria bacterium]